LKGGRRRQPPPEVKDLGSDDMLFGVNDEKEEIQMRFKLWVIESMNRRSGGFFC
jgi:hypothetical protein